MTDALDSERKTVREQALETLLEEYLQKMHTENGYCYDYGEAQIIDPLRIGDEIDLLPFAPGILLIDGADNLTHHVGAQYEQQTLEIEIVSVVEDSDERYRVISRLEADQIKAFFAFFSDYNGTYGPMRLTNKTPFDCSDAVRALWTSGHMLYQHADGDLFTG